MFFTSEKRTNYLIKQARQDPFMGGIIESLAGYGYKIRFSFLLPNGSYTPQIMRAKDDRYEDEFLRAHQTGAIYATFRLNAWHGRARNLHYLLHELVHFYQDLQGVFLQPLVAPDQTPIVPSPQSWQDVVLMTEAMAETETIKASWRLRQNGYPHAWQGALTSQSWRGLALLYEQKREEGQSETEAADVIFNAWFEGKHVDYYRRIAQQQYTSNLHKIGKSAEPQNFKTADVIRLLPNETRPAYLDKRYGSGDASHLSHIKMGSPPYLWQRAQN